MCFLGGKEKQDERAALCSAQGQGKRNILILSFIISWSNT